MPCPHGPAPAGTPEQIVYPPLSRMEVEEVRAALRCGADASPFKMRQLVETLLAAWDQNESVTQFARETDLRTDRDYTDHDRGWREGHNAAMRRLRVLLGIEESERT